MDPRTQLAEVSHAHARKLGQTFKSPCSPVWSATGARHVGNYWEGYSLKLRRVVQFYSDLEFDHWIMVESDPGIEDFCEQPVVASGWEDGRLVKSTIDFWLREKSGNEILRGIMYTRDVAGTVPSNKSKRRLETERNWALRQGANYEVVTEERIRAHPVLLQNWKRVLHYLRIHRMERIIVDDEKYLLDQLKTTVSRPLSVAVQALRPRLTVEAAQLLIFRLLHAGVLEADMATASLGEHTSIKLRPL